MKAGMNIQELLTEVQRQTESKRDFLAATGQVRMVQHENKLYVVLYSKGADQLQRFEISEQFHRQVSGRLQIPWRYYHRLLNDHPDLVIGQVNALFEREPETRLVRTLDGKARAFLSDRYRRLDNDEVLGSVLPPLVKGDIQNVMMSSYVGDDKMHLKVLFTDDRLAQDIGELPPGQSTGWQARLARGEVDTDAQHRVIAERDVGRDIVRPGIEISNSETGNGSVKVRGWWFRSFCLNGWVVGEEGIFNFTRNHLGARLQAGEELEIFSDETKRLQDQTLIAEMRDALMTMADPVRVQQMGDRLRAIKNGDKAAQPVAAVDAIVQELTDIHDSDKAGILEAFIGDADYSQWGMVNAVTAQANRQDISYERACEFEELGAKIMQFNTRDWGKIAQAELVAA